MMNAPNGVTAAHRASMTMSLMVASAGHVAARLWCRTASAVAEHIVDPAISRMRLRRGMADLGRLDARDLQDIGVNRGDFTAIRQGTFERANGLAEERIIFNPESRCEPAPRSEPADILRPCGPDPQWYVHCWFGD